MPPKAQKPQPLEQTENFTLNDNGCFIPRDKNPTYEMDVCINPSMIEDLSPELKTVWEQPWINYIKGIKEATRAPTSTCGDAISHEFFQDIETYNQVVFILYKLTPSKQFQGFVLGLLKEDKTFYIDVICAGKNLRNLGSRRSNKTIARPKNIKDGAEEPPTAKPASKSVGKILLNFSEWWALTVLDYNKIQLSALNYVINYYYNKQGYKFIKQGKQNENAAITNLMEKNKTRKFKDDDDVDEYMRVEYALSLSADARNKLSQPNFINSLNTEKTFEDFYKDLFGPDMTKTIAKGTKFDQETIPAAAKPKERLIEILKSINKTDSDILKTGKGGYFDLLLTLIKSGFSTQCPTSNVNYRTWYKFDTDEEKRLATCVDEGFRMQKSLTKDSINLLMKDCPKEKAQAPTVITQAPATASRPRKRSASASAQSPPPTSRPRAASYKKQKKRGGTRKNR